MPFAFGPYACRWSEAFCLTPLTLAIVNQSPLSPGHVLLLPRRVVPAFQDLTPAEAADLAATAHALAPRVRDHFRAPALTLALQDGPAAGQTVAHVHLHVLPRREGDFVPNDKVYAALDAANMAPGADPDDPPRRKRSPEEMAEEARVLRPLVADLSLPIPDDDGSD